MNTYIGYDDIKNRYPFSGIFSDVDINFHADDVSTVTSLTLDSIKDSRRSTEKLPTQINQLLVDIQSMDDGELARAYRTAKELKQSVEDIVFQERMPRFTTAFNRMFESLKYSRIENVGGKKLILFRKNGICNFDVEQLKIIFKNLKTVIDHIIQLLNDNKNKE